ncbi:uncharacterized protein H6S33_008059 [Morchella sextelata]|uniref:uncharacterized protein n=1 Tax=Morchella sextelata TaxID=1174677 RepID=UPI001D048447|nr:uncharacterized protein H6S33_008059 [Morchella sextelata]KAH0603055.1 hypothetical protein H6S33_008059 [Morchella sextelata]
MSPYTQYTTHFLTASKTCPVCEMQNVDTLLFLVMWGWNIEARTRLFAQRRPPWWKRDRRNKLKIVTIAPKGGKDPFWH